MMHEVLLDLPPVRFSLLPPMPRFRIAVAVAPFQLPLKEAVNAAAQIGAQGIQFDLRREVTVQQFGVTALKQLVHYVEERNLRIAAPTFTLEHPLYDRTLIDVRMQALFEAMELAAKLKSRQLTLRAGRIPDEAGTERDQMMEALRDLARHGNHLGVVLCLTPSEDAPATLLEICESITEGVVGIDFDPAGFVMTRRDPVAALRDLHAHVQHVQFRDGRRDVDGIGVEVPLGRGQVKWDECLALLDEMRFDQWGTVRRTMGDDRLYDSQRAIQAIRRAAMQL
ncbi:MAG: sugar phosphate isomerase/epimerase [Planctomycetota bacterium]|nr:MAG: sugar phosphate isomerase/epimerase [Planctomycetota bacterium]